MSVPKKRRSTIKVRRRRAGIHSKIKMITLNNIVICSGCSKPRLSHKYCCIDHKNALVQKSST